MSLSNAQKALLKTAQRDAAIADDEYREAIATVTGMPDCRSSTDPRLTDEHCDKLLKWFEAIFWSVGDEVTSRHHPSRVFRTRNFWRDRNPRAGQSSRDRYTESELQTERQHLEDALLALGYGFKYFAAIQSRIDPFSIRAYIAALRRTLASKQKKKHAAAT